MLTIAWIFDSKNVTLSSSFKSISFKGTKDFCVSLILSAYIPIAPVVFPRTFSPIIMSVVLPAALFMDDKVIFGAEASLVLVDSNIPNTFRTSGVFNDIFLSCTRVPKGKLPNSNPSLRVVPPVPDPSILDFVILRVFTLCFLFTLAFGFVFASVATKVAPWSADRSDPTFLICNDPFPLVNVNLSDVKTSVTPSYFLTNEYLSSSKGKNVSLVPAETAALIWLLDASMVTSNVFLIFKVAFDMSTSDILSFGNCVNKLLSSDFSIGVVINVRSDALKKLPPVDDVVTPVVPCFGNWPSLTPVTVATPVTEILLVPTSVTRTIDFKSLSKPPKLNKFPTLSLPGNWEFELVTVLKPVDPFTSVITAFPNINWSLCTTSLTKLCAAPTFPSNPNVGPAKSDLTSDTPKDVIANATLPFSIPLKISGSLGMISPCVSYKVNDVLFDTDDLKNPVAPLNLPSTKTGVESVWFVFKVTSVNVWTSYKETSYSLIFPFVELYDPDSKAKS